MKKKVVIWILVLVLMGVAAYSVPQIVKMFSKESKFNRAKTVHEVTQIDYLMNNDLGPYVKIQGYLYKVGYPLEIIDAVFGKNDRINSFKYSISAEYREDLTKQYQWSGYNTNIYLDFITENEDFVPLIFPINRDFIGSKGEPIPYNGDNQVKYYKGYAYYLYSVDGHLTLKKVKDDKWQTKLEETLPTKPTCPKYSVEYALENKKFELYQCLTDYNEAVDLMNQMQTTSDKVPVIRISNGLIIHMRQGIVDLSNIDSKSIIYLYDNINDKNYSTYTNGAYGNIAGFVDSDMNNSGKIRIKQAGKTGWIRSTVKSNNVFLIPESQINDYFRELDYYTVDFNGTLKHHINYFKVLLSNVSAMKIGKGPNFMIDNQKYYSFDGIYFYDNPSQLLEDTNNETNINSLNKDNPFYNYYQYLSVRTETSYSGKDLNDFLKNRGYTNVSKMHSMGDYFIRAQQDAGINGAMEFAWAIHESGYGLSAISKDKNNLFGMGAYDNNPYAGALPFNSVLDGIVYHAKTYLSRGYTNAISDLRFYGSNLGNKDTGMNVKYASDPYWGEKIAGKYFEIDRFMNFKDFNKYKIGINNTDEVINVYDAVKGNVVYKAEQMISETKIKNYPFVIVEELDGWYKILSDIPLKNGDDEICSFDQYDSKTGLYNTNDYSVKTNTNEFHFACHYDFNDNYAYIKKDNINIIN